jgi:hypothetical protein
MVKNLPRACGSCPQFRPSRVQKKIGYCKARQMWVEHSATPCKEMQGENEPETMKRLDGVDD